MEYKIINASSIKELETKINNSIKNGWDPLGGVSTIVLPNNIGPKLLQSMIKK